MTVSKGVAKFTNLSDRKAETITLAFTGGGLVQATSSSITVSPAAASKLVIASQPTTATAGLAFSPAPVVDEVDAYGNLETGDSSTTVSVALTSGAGRLRGSTQVTVSQGVANFSNLFDDQAGTIKLKFTGGALTSATSAAIAVNPAATSQFVVAGFPSPTTAGVAGTFTVTAEDAYGNTTPAYAGTVKFTSSDAQAVLPSSATLVNGVGSFGATPRTAARSR